MDKKKPSAEVRRCADCMNESVCLMWSDGRPMSPENAPKCPNYETVRDSAAYLIGKLDAQVPKWISVDEALPEHLGWVLVIGLMLNKRKKRNYGWCVPHVAEYRHGRWCNSDGMLPDLEDRSLKITHWMQLPSAPEVSV